MPGHKILLVDDNASLAALLARLFEAEGWAVVKADRGQQAIDLIARERPSAAVVDLLLPDMMGYDVAVALRKANVPFVFMTGVFKGGRAAAEARNQHGAAGYFEKPFEAKALVESLRVLLPGSPTFRRAPPPEEVADFDVEVAVEAEEAEDAIDLTGRVIFTEDGRVSAILQGDRVMAAPVLPTATPVPLPLEVELELPGGSSEGALDDRFPELMTAFHLAQQTGELTVQKGKVKKTVYFEKGRPCFAISNLLSDRFVSFMVRVGKITQGQFEAVRAVADRSGRRTGEVLVEMGLLREAEKLYYVAQQVKAIIYSIFGWEEGRYRLHFTDRAAGESVKLDLHPANLIVRGVKKLYKPERLARLLSPEDRLIPSQQPSYGLEEVELEDWEAELLPWVDGTRTLAELIRIANRPEQSVYAFLYAMSALRILEKR
jgi:two-component system, OmpR family, response regulator